jgi:hypothetical protein
MATDLQGTLNRLAGTTGKDANIWAGTTGKDLLGALNAKNGTTGLGLNAVCNSLAGLTGSNKRDAQGALATIP